MSKKFTAIKKTKKTLQPFSFILRNKRLSSFYDKENKLSSFVILLLINRIGDKQTLSILKENKEQFIDLFLKLECDDKIGETLKEFNQGKYQSIEEIKNKKSIFDSFINEFISFISSLNINLDLSNESLIEFLSVGLIYILYSLVDCQLDKDLEDILADPDYEKKVQIINNNTKLFAEVRNLILSYCKTNVSDFVGLINGLTNLLAKK